MRAIIGTTFLLAALSAQGREIQGTVLSAKDSTVLAGATCRLMDGTKMLAGAVSGTDGAFTVAADHKGSADLEVTMTGFSPTSVIIPEGSKGINLGVIWLDELSLTEGDKGTTLGEVTVTANPIVHTKGRTIVYPSAADVKASSTTISLFQKLPLAGLEANPINRSLSVDGGSPVILIDHVPSSISDVNALQPKDIEKIEYSQYTPARYMASGAKGLISITLKNRTDGGSVYFWGRSAVNCVLVDATLYGTYHQGPSQFTVTYIPSWRNNTRTYDHTVETYSGDDFRVELESSDRNPFWYYTQDVQLRYNFRPSMKTLFSATLNLNPFATDRRVYGTNTDSYSGDYDNFNHTHSKTFSPSVDLFLRQDFNARNTLEVEVVGTLGSDDYRRDNTYTYPDDRSDSYVMDTDSRRRSLISEVSYLHHFSDAAELTAGFKNTLSHNRNKYLTTDYEPVLTENNNYAYLRWGHNVGRVYYAVGTGLKMFWMKNDDTRRHFVRNLTDARVVWYIDSRWNVSAYFNYSSSIPSLSALTDYAQQVTPYLITNGNPELKESYNLTYNLQAAYTYRKFYIEIGGTYMTTPNTVISDVRYLGDHLFLSQSVNAKVSDLATGTVALRLSDINGFGGNLRFGLSHYRNEALGHRNTLTTFSVSIMVWWTKGPFTLSYWRKIPAKYLSGNMIGKEENGDALQLTYRPDKHWSFAASWMYMFDRKGTQYPSWTNSRDYTSVRERSISNNANMVLLSVSYNADFGSIFRSAKRNLNNRDTGKSLLEM